MTEITTVADLLRRGDAKAEAIGAPGRTPMTRGELMALVDKVGGALRSVGVGAEDAVGIVMPNGPENAAAFVSVACWATAAPLNPGYREDEFDFYLGDLEAKALIIQAGPDAPARAVAAKRGIRVIELIPNESGPAGAFDLSVPFAAAGSAHPSPQHVALVLHTSGTTSRPKIVPLRHSNLVASAKHISATLALTPSDRSLVIMPLFHIHGLIGALSSSLYAGASVFCPPGGFNALKFFGWLDEAKPTWYSAVPTMHQTVLSRGRAQRRDPRAKQAALHPVFVLVAAAAGDEAARGHIPLPGRRILWHDRGDTSDDQQPAAAFGAQARHGRHRRRSRCRDHGQ